MPSGLALKVGPGGRPFTLHVPQRKQPVPGSANPPCYWAPGTSLATGKGRAPQSALLRRDESPATMFSLQREDQGFPGAPEGARGSMDLGSGHLAEKLVDSRKDGWNHSSQGN